MRVLTTTNDDDVMYVLGFNFSNVLRDPKSAKSTDDLTVFLALSGSVGVKAFRKMLVKSTSGVHFINVLRAVFTCALLGSVGVKASHKMLVKSNPGLNSTNF